MFYFESLNAVSLRRAGVGETGNLGKGLEWRRKIGEKNKHKSKTRGQHSWTRSAHVGEARGEDNSEKLEKKRYL